MSRQFRQPRFRPPPGACEILLVRHGESAPHREGETFPLTDGHGDPPLAPEGRELPEFTDQNQSTRFAIAESSLLVRFMGGEEREKMLEEKVKLSDVEKAQVELRKKAFGERDDALVDRAPRANFPGIDQIEPGMRFQTEMDDGSPMVVTVVDVDDQWVTVDGNHEMAGKHLRFELEVVDVRKATAEEIAHGHVHGADGECDH